MTAPAYCPVSLPDGTDCWRPPHPDSKHGMCAAHWIAVANDLRDKRDHAGDLDTPRDSVVRTRCPVCGHLMVVRNGPFTCQNSLCTSELMEITKLTLADIGDITWQRMGVAMYLNPIPQNAVVYYLSFGGRIKIGTTTNLKNRLLALPHDQLLALEPGSYSLEKQRHREFSDLRIKGHQEWFMAAPRLLDHVAHVRHEHGDPELIRRAAA